MKKILPLLLAGCALTATAQTNENVAARPKSIYNATFRLPLVYFPFQSLSLSDWQKIDPSFGDLSATDPAWSTANSASGVSGGAGISAGLNFSPRKQTGNRRLVYGIELAYLPGQSFQTNQSRIYSKVVDTISYSSGQPDQYVMSDSVRSVYYIYSSSRVMVAPRIGFYFNQLNRFGFGVGVSGSAGLTVNNKTNRVSNVFGYEKVVDNPENPQYESYDYRNAYSERTEETKKARSTATFSGGAFAEINYRLGKPGSDLENCRIGLEFQAGAISTGLTKGLAKTSAYYSGGISVTYQL